MRIIYPTPEKIVQYNKVLLEEIKIKKTDQPKILSYAKLNETIRICKAFKGNIYDKASCLLIELVQKHVFASGNRRTAIFTVLSFLKNNNMKTEIKDNPKHARILTGVREGFYTHEEIKNWMNYGKIRKFKR